MIDPELIRKEAGSEIYEQGMALVSGGMLREVQRDRSGVTYLCTDAGKRCRVTLDENGVTCTCGTPGICVHAAAGVICAQESGALDEMEQYRAMLNAPLFFDAAGGVLADRQDVKSEITLVLKNGSLRAGLRLGMDKLYVVRSLPLFLEAWDKGESFAFGKGFSYDKDSMFFDDEQSHLLNILYDCCLGQDMSRTGADARLIPLSPRGAYRLLSALKDIPFRLMEGEDTYSLPGIECGTFPIEFFLSGQESQLSLSARMPHPLYPLTPDYSFVFAKGQVWELEENQKKTLAGLHPLSTAGTANAIFNRRDTGRVMNGLLPFFMCAGIFTIDPALEKRMTRVPLKARVYLDKEERLVTCKVTFVYNEWQIDPFSPLQETGEGLLLRDAADEKAVLDTLSAFGFRVRRGGAYLRGSDRIYDFITQGASKLSESCEVYFSNDFKRMRPRKATLTGRVTASAGRLHLDLEEGGTPIEELTALLEALRLKKKYFRFKEGSYLDLSDLEDWQPFAEAALEGADENGDMAAYRAAFLVSLIDAHHLPVQTDEATRDMAAFRSREAIAPLDCLRPYQQKGFEWMCSLHDLYMGGILADEMGLGKTVQTLAAISRCIKLAKEDGEEPLPSLIVSPTSLIYNWESEARRFTPDLDIVIIEGSRSVRIKQMLALKTEKPDIVITSYPLIRRDIAIMREVSFRFIILDEAQNIKNMRSVGARSVKQLQGRTRVALTGTPMENHAGEFWSLFDFVLPGYLPDYPEFLRRWGEGRNADELLMRIRPFLMRRLKKDVLPDLPPCTDFMLTAHMPPEQRRVYDAALIQSRERVKRILGAPGERGHAEILSAIMQLRQICCHPALCLPDYQGPSGKMDLLQDVLENALADGRRVLIFSQFTSMLHIIGNFLDESRIEWLYLDGNTPAQERVRLSDYFNQGGAQVFLVSLKAGGTGLNLTGADLVIHYDPWWNPAAEDQATSRAHRIGRESPVEVIRLVMHHSIEEDVLALSESKRRIFETLITPGEEIPTAFTETDILRLLGLDRDELPKSDT